MKADAATFGDQIVRACAEWPGETATDTNVVCVACENVWRLFYGAELDWAYRSSCLNSAYDDSNYVV